MHRLLNCLALLALTCLGLGCSMCEAPYDYCAATLGPNGQPTGGFLTRQGSILGGAPGVPYNAQAQNPTPAKSPTPAMTPTPAQPPGSIEGPTADASVTRPASATEPISQQDEAE
jgi:hypothetical protein